MSINADTITTVRANVNAALARLDGEPTDAEDWKHVAHILAVAADVARRRATTLTIRESLPSTPHCLGCNWMPPPTEVGPARPVPAPHTCGK